MKLLFIIIVFSFTVSVNSQPAIEWVRTLDGTSHENDGISDMVTDKAGNLYITGGLKNTGTGSDICTAKYSGSGQLLWMKSYTSNITFSSDWALKIFLDDLGNIYVGGNSQDGNYIVNSLVIKYNNDGYEIFTKRYFNVQGDRLQMFDMDIDILHNIYFTGYLSYQYDSSNCFVFKLNSSGDSLWCRSFPRIGNASTYGSKLKVSAAGNVYIGGNAALYFGVSTYLILKYNNAGVLQWSHYRNEFDYFGTLAMILDANENIYFSTQENVNWIGKSHIKKVSPAGNLLWDNTYYGDSLFHTYVWHMSFDRSNNLIATGDENDGSRYKSMNAKFTMAGSLQWMKVLDSASADYSVTDTSDNIYIIASGSTINHIPLGILYKIEKNGTVLWDARYTGPLSYGAGYNVVKISPDERSIYVGGQTCNQNGTWDCLILKYNQPIGIQQISTEIPKAFSLSQNFPNPFNPSTKIKFSLPNTSKGGAVNAKMILYDITGKQIAVLLNESLNPGTYEMTFDASAYSTGVYIYRIEARPVGSSTVEYTASKKMILIK